MSCRVHHRDGNTLVICSRETPRQPLRCKFCVQPATKLCDWPVEKQVTIPIGKVTPGMFLVYPATKMRRGLLVKVIGTEEVDPYMAYSVVVVRWLKASSLPLHVGRQSDFHIAKKNLQVHKVQILAMSTCDTPCCDNDCREVGENRHYCREHWRNFETASKPEQACFEMMAADQKGEL